jgi:hypothetical protein
MWRIDVQATVKAAGTRIRDDRSMEANRTKPLE